MITIRYFLCNGFFAYCVYKGLYLGSEAFTNAAVFIAWITSITSLILVSDEAKKAYSGRLLNNTVPLWFDQLFDFFIAGVFIVHGYNDSMLFSAAIIQTLTT